MKKTNRSKLCPQKTYQQKNHSADYAGIGNIKFQDLIRANADQLQKINVRPTELLEIFKTIAFTAQFMGPPLQWDYSYIAKIGFDLPQPIAAMKELHKRYRYYIVNLRKTARELERYVLPAISYSNPVIHEKKGDAWLTPGFQEYLDLPKKLREITTFLKDWGNCGNFNLGSNDRFYKSRAYWAAISMLWELFCRKSGSPHIRLIAAVINAAYDKDYDTDHIKKIHSRHRKYIAQVLKETLPINLS